MSEAVEKKALDYLTSGKVKVLRHSAFSAEIEVQGSDPVPYTVLFANATWACSCPARKPLCAHVLAAKLISPLRTETGGFAPKPVAGLDALLSGVKGTAPQADDLSWLGL